MKHKELTAEQSALLREVLEKRPSPLSDELIMKAEAGTLMRQERLRLCEMIGAEFAETGVGPDLEPTDRGKRLERLLDDINRANIAPRS